MERLKNSQILFNIISVIVEILINFFGRMGEGVIKFIQQIGKGFRENFVFEGSIEGLGIYLVKKKVSWYFWQGSSVYVVIVICNNKEFGRNDKQFDLEYTD